MAVHSQVNKKYLELLAKEFPNRSSAFTEIINLQSILNLPKATEHFMTDIHGAYEQFLHILRNGSGSIRRKIKAFSSLITMKISLTSKLRSLSFTLEVTACNI